MIEAIMFFGLGFLGASLLWVLAFPFVHARAVRLTARRLEAATPVSMAEIQADKDQLRAEFAMSTRRLEMSVEQLKTKTTSQLAELGRKTDAINRMKIELGEKNATIHSLEAREKALKDQLRATEDELAIKTGSLREAERSLSEKETQLAKLTADLNERSITSDSQRVELIALRTQVDALKEEVTGLEKQVRDAETRLAREKADHEKAASELSRERGSVEKLGARIAELESRLSSQITETEVLSRRLADLEMRLSEQSRLLAERGRERDQLRLELDAVRKIEADLRDELATIDRRHDMASESLRAEKALLEGQLERSREERAKLQRELAGIKREAESSWASERVENALLRERINDVAAEVARLTATLEGPPSPIVAILAEDAAANSAKQDPSAAPAGSAGEHRGSLADRIRALQMRASRLSQAT